MREELYDWLRPGEIVIAAIVSTLLIGIVTWAASGMDPGYRGWFYGVTAWIAMATLSAIYLSELATPSQTHAVEPSLRERLTPDFSTLFGEGSWWGPFETRGPGGGYPFGYYWGYDTHPGWIIFYIGAILAAETISSRINLDAWVYLVGFVILLIVSALLLPILIGWFSWYGYTLARAPFKALQVARFEARFRLLEEQVRNEFNQIRQMVRRESAERYREHGIAFRPMTFTDQWVNGQYEQALAGFNMTWLRSLPEKDALDRWVDSLELAAGLKPEASDSWVRHLITLDKSLAGTEPSSADEKRKIEAIRPLLRPLALIKLRSVGYTAFSPQALQLLIKFLSESPPEMLILPAFLRELRELGKRLQAIEPVARLTERALSRISEEDILARYQRIRDIAERRHLSETLAVLQKCLAGAREPAVLPTPEEARSQLTAWANRGPPNLKGPSRLIIEENFVLSERVMRSLLQESLPRVPLFWRMLAAWLRDARLAVDFLDFFLWGLAFLEKARDFSAEREIGSAIWILIRDTLMMESAAEAHQRLAEERFAIQSLLRPPVYANWAAVPEDLITAFAPG